MKIEKIKSGYFLLFILLLGAVIRLLSLSDLINKFPNYTIT
jgi:hypothetical protein